jgi:hypothetical protein
MSEKSVEDLRESLKEWVGYFEDDTDADEVEYIEDLIFEEIDHWFNNEFQTGRIDSMPPYPTNDYGRERLMNAVKLLELADTDAWVTEDSGLWEGMEGQQVLFAQAFHSAENLFREYLDDEYLDY